MNDILEKIDRFIDSATGTAEGVKNGVDEFATSQKIIIGLLSVIAVSSVVNTVNNLVKK